MSLKIPDQVEGEELKNNPPTVDYEPRAVHPLEFNEDSTLWKAPGG
jgi:hypothetical protein